MIVTEAGRTHAQMQARVQRIDRRRARAVAIVLVVAVTAGVPHLPAYWVELCITAAIDAVLLQSLGILVDRTNLFVFCPLSFAAIGAWVVLQVRVWDWPGGLFLWILFAGLAAIPFGLLMGIPALRLRGINLAVITLSFAVALDSVLLVQAFPGSQSDEYVTRPSLIAGDGSYFVFCWAIFVVFATALYVVDRRPFGASWRCVARSERATAAMGLSVRTAKVGVFVISAFMAGVAGALMVGQSLTASEASFTPSSSLVLFAVTLLVGAGFAEGAAAGGFLSSFTPQVLESLHLSQNFGNILFPIGAVHVLSVGNSLAGTWRARIRRMLRRRRAKEGSVTPGAVVSAAVAVEAEALRIDALPRARAKDRLRPAIGVPALRVSDLTVRYGRVVAVDHMNLTVPAGTVGGLIGPNGAGKSTFVDAVSGFVGRYDGRIEIDGRSVDGMLVHRRVKSGVRRTFQQERTIPELTVGEYVRVAARRPISIEEVGDVLEFIGGASSYERIADIDVGARRLVEIAGCLAARPKILLLDEPTAGLAEAESLAVAARIAMVPEVYGCAVLLIEHDMRVVRAACAHITVLDFGRTIAEGAPEEVLQLGAVVSAYLGDQAKSAVVGSSD